MVARAGRLQRAAGPRRQGGLVMGTTRIVLTALLVQTALACGVTYAQEADTPVQRVLERLEQAGRDLQSFTSRVRYTVVPDLGGVMRVRDGRLAYAVERTVAGDGDVAPTRRRFAIAFQTLWVGERLIDDERAEQTIAFDGRWLVEKLPAEKTLVRREVVPAGSTVDPFAIGDGPFPPLPIGQDRREILDRYEVRLADADEGIAPDPSLDRSNRFDRVEIERGEALVRFAQGCTQLVLTPRAGASADRFSQVRLWYKPGPEGRLLPRMSRTVDATSGDVAIVQLFHPLEINGPVREDVLSTTAPAGWEVSIVPLESGQGGTGRTDRPR